MYKYKCFLGGSGGCRGGGGAGGGRGGASKSMTVNIYSPIDRR